MRTGQNIYKRKDGRWEARVPLAKEILPVPPDTFSAAAYGWLAASEQD